MDTSLCEIWGIYFAPAQPRKGLWVNCDLWSRRRCHQTTWQSTGISTSGHWEVRYHRIVSKLCQYKENCIRVGNCGHSWFEKICGTSLYWVITNNSVLWESLRLHLPLRSSSGECTLCTELYENAVRQGF